MNQAQARGRIRVMVVDDSAIVRELLTHLLGCDPGIQLVGVAGNGRDAVRIAALCRPEVITMDFHMPAMNGLDATRQIMQTCPVPIVIVAGSSVRGERNAAFQLFEAGALAIVDKPPGPEHPGHAAAARHFVQTVKLMSEVRVLRFWPKSSVSALQTPKRPGRATPAGRPKLVAVGASTGGPLVLKNLLTRLGAGFPLPVVIVQHIASGFAQGFAEWLSQASGFPVELMVHGMSLRPGHAYVAPDHRHVRITAELGIELYEGAALHGHSPSITKLFRSVAVALGSQGIGILLSGMGRDGADGLLAMRQSGACTVVQQPESCVVDSMPAEALLLDAALHVLPPDDMAVLLRSLSDCMRENHDDS
jgi:two-component system, chemotaxis family, protein-glutamate methylesterase/glutaminase